ncbi:MAG: Na+/H+ antiporter subunit C [Rhodobacterales bacterium]|nr:Na+/H+ antiporter subunit C [Rhodobacterales bacterium]
MELLIAAAVGGLTAAGVYLMLRQRAFPVILGLSLLSYAVNLFIFASGRVALALPPILDKTQAGYTDPLPQALVLTAIVISFGMTGVIVMMALGSWLHAGDDRIDMTDDDRAAEGQPPRDRTATGDRA